MKILLKTFLTLCFTGLLVIGIGMVYAAQMYQSPGPLQNEKIIQIERGSGVNKIARTLHLENIISQPQLFSIAARITGNHTHMKAGEYRFEAGITMKDALDKIASGDVLLRQFTVPEGLTSWQIVQKLNTIETLSGEITDIPAEGSLLPETYTFMKGDTKQSIINHMQDGMRNTIDELWETRDENLPFSTPKEALILASIIEKETSVPAERKNVAGVFVNRLRKNIALQTDPTVIYALTKGKIQDEGQGPLGRRLLRKDLQIDSPYNTYLYAGLPPGPIANPGRDSIAAALQPATHEYYYFVADGTGGHAFAKTLEEHNNNVAKWRKIRKSQ